jgi:hypothetical protein
VKVALAPLIDLAHRRGGTVNDLVLTAVSGAVGTLLLRRYCAVVNLGRRVLAPCPVFVVTAC